LENASLLSITDLIRNEVLGVPEYWNAGVAEKRISARLVVQRFIFRYFLIDFARNSSSPDFLIPIDFRIVFMQYANTPSLQG
jgi:hypothetical protein